MSIRVWMPLDPPFGSFTSLTPIVITSALGESGCRKSMYRNDLTTRNRWYNSTYTLCAGMIVLYVAILRSSSVLGNDLLDDVKKCRDILNSMEEASVARRSAALMSEGLEVAEACIQRRQSRASNMGGETSENAADGQRLAAPSSGGHMNDVQHSVVSEQAHESLWSSLIDPMVLQDFATQSDANLPGLDFSALPIYDDFDFTNNGLDTFPQDWGNDASGNGGGSR